MITTVKFKPISQLVSTILLNIALCSVVQASEPPQLPDMELVLEIVVNGKPTGQVVPIKYHGGHYIIASKDLVNTGLPLPSSSTEEVTVDTLDKLHVSYDSAAQQLLIDVPNDWLPEQQFLTKEKDDETSATNSLGLLMNYDVYANQTTGNNKTGSLSALTEQRLFGDLGILSNQGIYQYDFRSEGERKNRYLRYDTSWRLNDEAHMMKYMIGDVVSQSLSWSNGIRLGGIQISRNFSTQPEFITYPLPEFAGQASVPSAVDLYINSYKASQVSVNPGPFTLDTVPYINGAGEATLVVTDALGRQVSTSVPFYVSSDLLRQGLLDFNLSGGAIRRQYGVKSFEYDDWAYLTNARYGLTNWLTLEARAEGASKLTVLGGGAVLKLGWLGVINGSYTGSDAKPEVFKYAEPDFGASNDKLRGQQTSFGYSYSRPLFSINASRTLRDTNFGDLASYKIDYRLSRRTDQLTGSLGLGRSGVIGAGYFDVQQHNGDRLRLVNFSYSVALWRNTSLYASVNRQIGGEGYSSQIVFNIPLGNYRNTSFSASRNTERDWSYAASYDQGVPTQGGLGWDVTYSDGEGRKDAYKQVGGVWRSHHMETRAGIYGERNYTYWGELSGSLVAMDKQFYATNLINDSFVLVSTDGFAGIPISYENQIMGTTNDAGYLLIPSVGSYYKASYGLDPLNLPADMTLPEVQKRVSVKEGSGYVMRFPMHKTAAVNAKLYDEENNVLPVGSVVKLNDAATSAYVGWEGVVYLENVRDKNALVVTRADNGQVCRASFSLEKLNGIQSISGLICKSDKTL